MRLNTMKMTMKRKNRSHRYNINRPRCRHGRKYSKYSTYIMCLTMMMLVSIKSMNLFIIYPYNQGGITEKMLNM